MTNSKRSRRKTRQWILIFLDESGKAWESRIIHDVFPVTSPKQTPFLLGIVDDITRFCLIARCTGYDASGNFVLEMVPVGPEGFRLHFAGGGPALLICRDTLPNGESESQRPSTICTPG